jgi:ABC-type glycerol-3-phosphate transport system substrate-binding protein
MKKLLILFSVLLLLVTACGGEQSVASEQADPEVTVFRAPT